MAAKSRKNIKAGFPEDGDPTFPERPEGEQMLIRYRWARIYRQKIPDDVDMFLMDGFARILGGVAPKKALKLERPKGRKQPSAEVDLDRLFIACEVQVMIDAGRTYAEAVIEVAKSNNKSEKTVEHFYTEKRTWIPRVAS